MNITDFLEARIAEDAEEAQKYQQYEDQVWETAGWWEPTRVLAECAAKRALLDIDFETSALFDNHRALAAVYREHSDYQPEWAL